MTREAERAASGSGSRWAVTYLPPPADVAALAGTSRETCTKVLRDYADHGLLRLARGRITVLDPERLKDAAG
ncbi:helix-turn-helix domain-containing protein [Streptomyces sp. NPDC048558]|uniref:helix-turn-helix domain-containing protein n=1 Tax=Streptomyces sp. NPDC048558 TaxID=3155759 RepID=UPI0033ECD6FE